MSRRQPPTSHLRALGFTLVELMVAVALGMLIMVALIAVYMNVSRTNSEMYKTNGLIENGRFAVDFLNEDLAHGGYWGGYVPQFDDLTQRIVPPDVPDAASLAMGPCAAYAAWTPAYRNLLIGVPVEVFGDGTPTGCDTTTLIKDRKAGTDVLVVRHVDTCSPGDPNCEALDANKVYFQNSQCANELGAGMYFVLSRTQADFTLKRRGCTGTPPAVTVGTLMPIRKFVSNIYYIRTWAVTVGDGIPTLVRVAFGPNGGLPAHEAPAQALIEGIEDLKVELGIDGQGRCGGAVNYTVAIDNGVAPSGPSSGVSGGVVPVPGNLVDPSTCAFNPLNGLNNTLPTVRGDGVPESYVRCPAAGCTVEQLRDVVAVKVYVLARSRDISAGHADTKTYTMGSAAAYTPAAGDQGYKRHLFQTTVRLTNISARRETPTP
jgi:type IV pilus assembly protein PilW